MPTRHLQETEESTLSVGVPESELIPLLSSFVCADGPLSFLSQGEGEAETVDRWKVFSHWLFKIRVSVRTLRSEFHLSRHSVYDSSVDVRCDQPLCGPKPTRPSPHRNWEAGCVASRIVRLPC